MLKNLVFIICFLALIGCDKSEYFTGKACFSSEPEVIYINEEVNFINCSENASHYYWDFGDGNSSTEKDPTHSYSESGIYRVLLFVQNSTFKDHNGDGLLDEYDSFHGENDMMETRLYVRE